MPRANIVDFAKNPAAGLLALVAAAAHQLSLGAPDWSRSPRP